MTINPGDQLALSGCVYTVVSTSLDALGLQGKDGNGMTRTVMLSLVHRAGPAEQEFVAAHAGV